MGEIIISALALGISVGTSCVLICAPFYIPYLITQERKMKTNFLEFLKFLLGRLGGYLLFGFFVGYLGKQLNVGWVSTLSTVSLGILAFLMILYAFNFFKGKLFCLPGHFMTTAQKIKPPFWIGFLTGINLCPPFLLSLNYIFIVGDIIKGLIFFFFFFLATNIYFIPLVFLGKLAFFKEFQTFARWTTAVVGLMFFVYAIYSLIAGQNFLHYGRLF